MVEKAFDDNWKLHCLAPSLIQSDCHLECHLGLFTKVGIRSLCRAQSNSEPLVIVLVARLGYKRKRLPVSTLVLSSHETPSTVSFKFLDGTAFTFCADNTTWEEKSHYKPVTENSLTPGVKTCYLLVMIKIVSRTGNGTAQIRFHDNNLMNVKSIGNGTNVTIPLPPSKP